MNIKSVLLFRHKRDKTQLRHTGKILNRAMTPPRCAVTLAVGSPVTQTLTVCLRFRQQAGSLSPSFHWNACREKQTAIVSSRLLMESLGSRSVFCTGTCFGRSCRQDIGRQLTQHVKRSVKLFWGQCEKRKEKLNLKGLSLSVDGLTSHIHSNLKSKLESSVTFTPQLILHDALSNAFV